MKDEACVNFLQWCLPHLHMRWPGFRKVRNQVCKRLQHRLYQLELEDLQKYQQHLKKYPDEWLELDKLCQITISRFYRDKIVFSFLEETVFPRLLNILKQRQENVLRIWCAGSGAGEEPFTLAIVWTDLYESRYPDISLSVVGSEINPDQIKRANRACYPYSAIKNLPPALQVTAFIKENDQYCLRPKYQHSVSFHCQDIRQLSSFDYNQPYHLICCRNLAFTYYDIPLQRKILKQFHLRLVDGGFLLIGVHEKLPNDSNEFNPISERLGIYLKSNNKP